MAGLRRLARTNAAGAFRPNKAAPGLRRGWIFTASTVSELERALDHLYPGPLPDWFAGRSAPPPVTPFKVSNMTLATDPNDGYQVLQFTSAISFNSTENGTDRYPNAPGTYRIRYKQLTGALLTAALAQQQNRNATACWTFQFLNASNATTQPEVAYCK